MKAEMCDEAFHSRLPRRTYHVDGRRHSDQPRASPGPAKLHSCRTDAPVHAGHEVGTAFDGDRDLGTGRCRNRLDIPIKPLAAVDRRQRGACGIPACAHRHVEQISGVVSLDIPPDDYPGGARGCGATAREQGPQRGLPRTLKHHTRQSGSAIEANRDRALRSAEAAGIGIAGSIWPTVLIF